MYDESGPPNQYKGDKSASRQRVDDDHGDDDGETAMNAHMCYLQGLNWLLSHCC